MYSQELRYDLANLLSNNRSSIEENWIKLAAGNTLIANNKPLLKISLITIDRIINCFINSLTSRSSEVSTNLCNSIASELAYKDIQYRDFLESMQLFEKSYEDILLKEDTSINTLRYSMLINSLFNKIITSILEEYFDVKDTTVVALVKLAELRDDTTGNHLERTREYTVLLSNGLELEQTFIKDIERASLLHDIGKVGIKDSILLKPDRLTEVEFEEMKQHTIIGARTIDEIIKTTSSVKDYLLMARDIALYHHEKYNGTGYPYSMKTNDIPLCARIFAVADAYDAIVSRRPYKEPLSHEEAVTRIVSNSGIHFDPQVVKAFEKVEWMFNKINSKHKEIYELEVVSY